MAGLVTVRDPITATLAFRSDLVFRLDYTGGRAGHVIEDPLRGKFFRLGAAEFAFLTLLDGHTTIAAAVGRAASQLGPQALSENAPLSENDALALCHWAMENQLAQPLGAEPTARIESAAARYGRSKALAALNPLCLRIPLVAPDRFFARIAGIGGTIFTWPAFIVWSAAVCYAIYLAAANWTQIESSTSIILDRDNWLRLGLAWIMLKVLHETAHGLACKRYGGTVRSAGVTLLFFMPLAYVDVTSSWRFSSKWQRMITSAAGIYADLFAAALATVAWAAASPGVVKTMALDVAMTAGVSTLLFNANPLVRFDGYFILSDLLEIPNLGSCGQQWIARLLQTQLLGREAAAPAWPRAKAWTIGAYAVAALAWRAMFFLTLALILVGALGHLGIVLAALMLGFAWGVPLVQTLRHLRQAAAGGPMNVRRVAISLGAAFAALLVIGFLLARPSRVTAPAVVEYAPLSIMRAAAPGFVERVLVASGDAVIAGQPIVVLRNDELTADLADLQLAYEQSLVKSRMLLQTQEAAKQQVEAADRAALEKKLGELKQRVAALTIRAVAAGRVYARDIDSLQGRYLATGDEVAIIGSEEAKDLLIAVPQDDVELFEHQIAKKDVYVRAASGDRSAARLASIDPRGSSDLPHAALSAAVGGPLAVKPITPTADEHHNSEQKYELTLPVFQAKAVLPPDDGRRLRAGQVVTVSFRSDQETVATRIGRSVQTWIGRFVYASHNGP